LIVAHRVPRIAGNTHLTREVPLARERRPSRTSGVLGRPVRRQRSGAHPGLPSRPIDVADHDAPLPRPRYGTASCGGWSFSIRKGTVPYDLSRRDIHSGSLSGERWSRTVPHGAMRPGVAGLSYAPLRAREQRVAGPPPSPTLRALAVSTTSHAVRPRIARELYWRAGFFPRDMAGPNRSTTWSKLCQRHGCDRFPPELSAGGSVLFKDWRSLEGSGPTGVTADDETLSETAIQGATAIYSRPKRQNGAKA
jgi:hypothetical protein